MAAKVLEPSLLVTSGIAQSRCGVEMKDQGKSAQDGMNRAQKNPGNRDREAGRMGDWDGGFAHRHLPPPPPTTSVSFSVSSFPWLFSFSFAFFPFKNPNSYLLPC
ncbi:hypothetical protein BO70DRAFT_216706 [Aspergillus heteromorphus CBS 117.55]|uniref:Uncharacterized protein n=1 Tax=Aspergillus heteromorphus CBS 117.55 TaxID=1448321 RepID=A0A317UUY9_9EURO|nr:uncharacterized protein BO70DRAFT_216706 [Aspergillus heteromorphus CBS 117.55]PWY63880.1 hypothetical protein BO70DRAFT_216706 [Aspergillus heteromorphus CBS 117.55]